MTLVVDASVAVEWVLKEADSDAARSLLRAEQLVAPDFLMLEAANVLAQQVKRRLLTAPEAEAGLKTVAKAGVRLVAGEAFFARTQQLAIELSQTTYDCLYLAVALGEGATLVTADGRFATAVEAHPVYAPHLRRL